MKLLKNLLLSGLIFTYSCSGTKNSKTAKDDGIIEVIFLQINDVYEIAPLEGGTVGGMARLATLRNQLIEENPNTLTVLAGDFLNPSVIATLSYNEKAPTGSVTNNDCAFARLCANNTASTSDGSTSSM